VLEPKELILTDASGKIRTFTISKFPAIAGREIVTKYPISNMPKLGEYQQSEEVMLKLMAHVAAVTADGAAVQLTTRALVDNHVGDWETLAKVEWAMLEYNCSFFRGGLSSGFLESISQKAVTWISQTLIPSLEPLLRRAKQASGNSKPN
jgi:hypothetical protein